MKFIVMRPYALTLEPSAPSGTGSLPGCRYGLLSVSSLESKTHATTRREHTVSPRLSLGGRRGCARRRRWVDCCVATPWSRCRNDHLLDGYD